MKYLFLLLAMSAQLSYAQQNEKVASTTIEYPDCPAGLCPVAYISIDLFNFHKPRTNCTSGFGLCIRLSAGITCEYCRWRTSIEQNQVASTVIFEGDKAIWHLPLGMIEQIGDADTNEFEIEAGMLEFVNEKGERISVKGGRYPVNKNAEDITIELSLTK